MKNKKTIMFVVAMLLTVQASMATNITSNVGGITNTGNTWNINPAAANGGTGFRYYTDFNLSEGEIANLIFKYGAQNIETFINLVNNKVNINGIVNTMRDGGFYNGHAMFITPKGMVIGSSGVLNVGSLSVLTPTQATFDKAANDMLHINLKDMQNEGTHANIKVDGTILARGNVNLQGALIETGADSKIMAFSGLHDEEISTKDRADELFNNLVNVVDDVETQKTFATRNGKIILTSKGVETTVNDAGEVVNAGISLNGKMYNLNKGNLKLVNYDGSDGINTSGGELFNANGILTVDNSAGNVVLGAARALNGNILIGNKAENGYSHTNDLTTNNGEIKIFNKGSGGLTVSGEINSAKDITIASTGGNFNLDANVTHNSGNIQLINRSTNGKMSLNGSIYSADTISIENTGAQGLEIAGSSVEGDEVHIINRKGSLTIDASISSGDRTLSIYNSGGSITTTTNGDISSVNGNVIVNNQGNGFTADGNIEAKGIEIINKGGALEVNGNITNNSGDLVVYAYGDGGTKLGVVNNKGNVTSIKNKHGNLEFTGKVTSNGNMAIFNEAADGYLTLAGVENKTGKTNIVNKGVNGTNVNGIITVNDNLNLYNDNGKLSINSDITANNGKLNVLNRVDGTDMELAAGATITGKGISTVVRNDNGNMLINGNIDNQAGKLAVKNSGNNMTINGEIKNSGEVASVLNAGTGTLTVDGKVVNTSGNLGVVNRGKGLVTGEGSAITNSSGVTNIINSTKGIDGTNINGEVTGTGVVNVKNDAGMLNINGIVQGSNDVNIESRYKSEGINIGQNASITSSGGNINIKNNARGGEPSKNVIGTDEFNANTNNGINIDGTVLTDGNAENNINISTSRGNINVNGSVSAKGNANVTITTQNGKVILKDENSITSESNPVFYNLKNKSTKEVLN